MRADSIKHDDVRSVFLQHFAETDQASFTGEVQRCLDHVAVWVWHTARYDTQVVVAVADQAEALEAVHDEVRVVLRVQDKGARCGLYLPRTNELAQLARITGCLEQLHHQFGLTRASVASKHGGLAGFEDGLNVSWLTRWQSINEPLSVVV